MQVAFLTLARVRFWAPPPGDPTRRDFYLAAICSKPHGGLGKDYLAMLKERDLGFLNRWSGVTAWQVLMLPGFRNCAWWAPYEVHTMLVYGSHGHPGPCRPHLVTTHPSSMDLTIARVLGSWACKF